MKWRLSDKEYIERIRRIDRHRRALALVVFAVGLIILCWNVWMAYRIDSMSREIFQSLESTKYPTTQQMDQMVDFTKYRMGFTVGMIFAGGLGSGGMLLISGFILFFRNRRNDLLVKSWDTARELGHQRILDDVAESRAQHAAGLSREMSVDEIMQELRKP